MTILLEINKIPDSANDTNRRKKSTYLQINMTFKNHK